MTRRAPTVFELATGTAPKRLPPRQYESIEQRLFVQWWRQHLDTRDLPACAIPNGGGRSKAQAGILKAEGVSAGAPDWICFEPMVEELPGGEVRHWKGLALEFKRPEVKGERKGVVSPAQARWHEQLRARGWRVEVVTTSQAAILVARTYLRLRR